MGVRCFFLNKKRKEGKNIEVAVVEETEQIESIDDSKSHHMSNDHNNDEDAEEDSEDEDGVEMKGRSIEVLQYLVPYSCYLHIFSAHIILVFSLIIFQINLSIYPITLLQIRNNVDISCI